jgi:hypothetical protein
MGMISTTSIYIFDELFMPDLIRGFTHDGSLAFLVVVMMLE